MRRIAAAALAVSAAVLAGGASLATGAAGTTGVSSAGGAVKLAIGDTIDVKNTGVVCFAVVSNKKPGLGCVLWKGNAPRIGSYGVGIATDGTVVVNQILADGSAKTLLKRVPQLAGHRSASAAGKVYAGLPGDTFGLPIDKTHILGCRVVDVKPSEAVALYQGIKIACWRADNEFPVPNSNGVQISDRMAAAYSFNAKGVVTKTLLVKRQP